MNYLYPCLLFVWIAYIWETYLQWRQRTVYKISIPDRVLEIMDEKTFTKSQCYQLDKSSYSLFHGFYKQMEFLIIILAGGIPLVWDLAGSIIAHYGYNQDYEVLQSLVFLFLTEVYSAITGFPWTIYCTFVLEEKHGFNKQTASFFMKDQVKKFVLSCVLNLSIMAGLISVIRWGGDYFYIYAWFFVLAVSVIFIFVYHDFIAPCFDKYTPLPEGPLRQAIEHLATSLQFPLKKLLVVEGSKRSAHSNAYFYGFWKNKCIVLFDTLVEEGILSPANDKPAKDATPTEDEAATPSEDATATPTEDEGMSKDKEDEAGGKEGEKKKKGCNTAEVLGILAHELGHWKLSHNIQNIIISELNLLFTLFLFGFFMKQQDMYSSFGFSSSRPVLIGLLLFLQLVLLPYIEVFSFLFTQLTRWFEFQADAFAVNLGHADALGSALIKLNKDNLSFPLADPIYSAFHHSHPTLLERLEALEDKKRK